MALVPAGTPTADQRARWAQWLGREVESIESFCLDEKLTSRSDIAKCIAAKDSIQGQLAAAREERRKVQAALDEATKSEALLETRVEELTRELADLKRIDMERDL